MGESYWNCRLGGGNLTRTMKVEFERFQTSITVGSNCEAMFGATWTRPTRPTLCTV